MTRTLPSPATQSNHKEIRLRWTIGGSQGVEGMQEFSGLWRADTPTNRSSLQVVMHTGNATYGCGSHWIEEREVK